MKRVDFVLLRGRKQKKDGFGHEAAYRGKSDEWFTPKPIVDALGPFDLDPCSAENRPWPTAKKHYSDGGLWRPWTGMVWLNPPYGPQTGAWLSKLADHGRGIALTFARTDTQWFREHVWLRATCVVFLNKRICFVDNRGNPGSSNAGAPSVLVGYGIVAMKRLRAFAMEHGHTWLLVNGPT